MTEARCPRCHGALLEEIELSAGDPPVLAWWCRPCALVVRHADADHVPVPRARADVDA